MQLSCNPQSSTFKSLYITPSGHQAIRKYDSRNHNRDNLISTIYKEQEKREHDLFVDAVISGKPDEYGDYYPILCIKDKVTGKYYRGGYRADSPSYFWGNKCKTKDGELVDENTVIVTDSRGEEFLIPFENGARACEFTNYVEVPNPNCTHSGILKLGLVENLEKSYRKKFGIDDSPKTPSEEFSLKYNLQYKTPLEEVVPSIMKENNLIGRGREKDVYKIPGMNEYVFCVVRDDYDENRPIAPFYKNDELDYRINRDTPVMMNDNGMYIKKYTKGISHSLPNWIEKAHNPDTLTYDDVKLFTSQLEDLSSFPVKSYVNFAKELQKLNKTMTRIDTINPNNIIIDSDLKTISVIDITPYNAPSELKRPINGLSDMESALMDSIMFTTYYDMANDEDKAKLDNYGKTIIKKCGIAAKVSNLGNLPDNTINYIDYIDRTVPLEDGSKRRDKFNDFREHFKDDVSEEVVSTQLDPSRMLYYV